MSKKNKLYLILLSLVVFVVLSGFLWSFIVTKDMRTPNNNQIKNQSVSVNNLILTETKNEKIYWELYAEKGSYESNQGDVVLSNLTGNFYNSENQVVMSFKSNYGFYNEESKVIILRGDILVVTNEDSSIRADEVVIKGKDDDIIAKGNVIYQKGDEITTHSNKARFNSELTFFEISGKTETKVYTKNESKAQILGK